MCTVAPIPGETKVWQYISLMKRIYLIDCPGVVPPSNGDSEEDILLRGVVRVENVENPAQYIPTVLRRAQSRHIERTYDVKHSDYNDDAIEFLSILARKGGRLLRGGEADVDGVAKMVLNDFLRGKIPWFSAPPRKDGAVEEAGQTKAIHGRQGRLGEMPSHGHKRKRDELQTDNLGLDDHDDVGGRVVQDANPDNDEVEPTEGPASILRPGLEIGENDGDDAEDSDEHDGGIELNQDSVSARGADGPFEAFSSSSSSSDEEEDPEVVPPAP